MSDRLTVLTTADQRRLAKVVTQTADGYHVEGYEAGSRYRAGHIDVASLEDIEAALWRLAEDGQSCVIRGAIRDGAQHKAIVNRCQHVQEDGRSPDWDHARPGRRWVAFDIDKMPVEAPAAGVDDTWLVGIVRQARAMLPEPFASSSCCFKLSSSAGLDGWATASMHLWFWLDRPVYDLSWRRWADGVRVDPSLFRAVQPHYTADPVFVGCADPLGGCRIGRIVEGPLTVSVPAELTDYAGWLDVHKAELAARTAELSAARARIVEGFGQSSSATRRYAMQALSGCLGDVLSAPIGGRHAQLVTKAYKLGGYIQDGFLDEGEVMAALGQAIHAVFPAGRHADELRTAQEMVTAGMGSPLDLSHIGRGVERQQSTQAVAAAAFSGAAKVAEKIEAAQALVDEAGTDASKKEALRLLKRAEREHAQLAGKAPLFVGQRDDGSVPCSPVNVRAMLDFHGIEVKHNVMTANREIIMPDEFGGDECRLTTAMAKIRSIARGYQMGAGDALKDELQVVEDENAYHPVKDWIDSRAWDGVDRFEDLWRTIVFRDEAKPDEDMYRAMLRAWLVAGAKCAMLPPFVRNGIDSHGVLVLQGKQGCGKTTWLTRLAPHHLGFSATGVHLDPSDKDSVTRATRVWLAELGEIDSTLRKADIAMLKAFLTADNDVYRRPYGDAPDTFARRTFYAASVNEERFLKDTTGNRRFWVLPIKAMLWRADEPYRIGDIDVQQLWAQFAKHAADGELHVLSRDMEARQGRLSEDFRQVDPVEEEIRACFDVIDDTGLGRVGMTTTEIYQTLYPNKDLDKWTQSEKLAVGKALTSVGAHSFRSKHGNKFTVSRKA
jgi:hypothetical protein